VSPAVPGATRSARGGQGASVFFTKCPNTRGIEATACRAHGELTNAQAQKAKASGVFPLSNGNRGRRLRANSTGTIPVSADSLGRDSGRRGGTADHGRRRRFPLENWRARRDEVGPIPHVVAIAGGGYRRDREPWRATTNPRDHREDNVGADFRAGRGASSIQTGRPHWNERSRRGFLMTARRSGSIRDRRVYGSQDARACCDHVRGSVRSRQVLHYWSPI